MSMECGECERDLRGGHDESCSRYDPRMADCVCDPEWHPRCPVHPGNCGSESKGVRCVKLAGHTGVHKNEHYGVSWGTAQELLETLAFTRKPMPWGSPTGDRT